jgi:hypothetical protein
LCKFSKGSALSQLTFCEITLSQLHIVFTCPWLFRSYEEWVIMTTSGEVVRDLVLIVCATNPGCSTGSQPGTALRPLAAFFRVDTFARWRGGGYRGEWRWSARRECGGKILSILCLGSTQVPAMTGPPVSNTRVVPLTLSILWDADVFVHWEICWTPSGQFHGICNVLLESSAPVAKTFATLHTFWGLGGGEFTFTVDHCTRVLYGD